MKLAELLRLAYVAVADDLPLTALEHLAQYARRRNAGELEPTTALGRGDAVHARLLAQCKLREVA